MRTTVKLSALVMVAFLFAAARPAWAQTPPATAAPFPYAPPPGFGGPDGGAPSVPEPQGPQVTEVPEAVHRPVPLRPTELAPVEPSPDDSAALEAQTYPSDEEADGSYLAADETIADGYDDGYGPDAYSDFQQALTPYGSWVNDADYGEIWIPALAIVGADFLPYYSAGHWVLSEYGWTWVSDWNWGWAPFHYGRWLRTANRGWGWIPGTTWGPAWVSWRSGAGYVGWAPLPPRGVTLAAAIPGQGSRSPWRFAPAASLGAARATGLPPGRVPGIFARTTVVSNDRLLTHGPYAVHVNAGPVHAGGATPIRLATVAPRVLPRSAILPRPGAAVAARPWTRVAGSTTAVPSGPSEWRGQGRTAPLGARTAAAASPRSEQPRPFVYRSSAAPAWHASSVTRPTPASVGPGSVAPASAPPAARAYVAPSPARARVPVASVAPSAGPGPAISPPRYGASYSAPSHWGAQPAPSGASYVPAPAHAEPRPAFAPSPAPAAPPVHVAPVPAPVHTGGAQPVFSPPPRAPAPSWGGGSAGGPARGGGAAIFHGRR